MATVKNIGFNNYCDRMYRELSDMRTRLSGFVNEIEHMKGKEKVSLQSHVAHFQDLIRAVDWKLEILTRVCPYEWSGYGDVEKTASIRVDEDFVKRESIGAGNVGG